MPERISCFVMSGGVGSRLWPLSREDNPKQFHDLAGHGSMLVNTVRRLKARPAGDTPVHVIASERHSERVRADLAGIDLAGGHAIFEPVGRNTAAAVAVAALETIATHGDGLVLVVPSDHEISTEEQFWNTVEKGVPAAEAGRLVVFGIPPDSPETGYGYIESVGKGNVRDVARFVEKPGLEMAKAYVASGTFFWNAGIFLFRAGAMRAAFREHQAAIWQKTECAFAAAATEVSGTYLPIEQYSTIPSASIDYAIMEHASGIAMVPASFCWSDLGSWQSLLDISPTDGNGNVVIGDVVAIDCERSYLRSQGRLLSVIGLRDVAIVSTADATFVAPVAKSQEVKRIVEQLEKSGRLETKFTPAHARVLQPGAWRERVAHWLFEETLPLWSTAGVDERHGGFHEALSFEAAPLMKPKRMRTMARQVYAFSVAKLRGWDGDADGLIAHGIAFMEKGRTQRGGWARVLQEDGTIADACEDAYDHACVLLMLAHAYQAGNPDALRLGQETFAFLDEHLEDDRLTGFLETSDGTELRRSNPHMHLLEAFLAWYAATGERGYLRRAARIIDLFRSHFFDTESWTLGEYFDEAWNPAVGPKGQWTEPGHHFEWASLLVEFAAKSRQTDLIAFARKLYASAIATGLNRSTGLAYGAVSRAALPLDLISRSWPQAEAVKAALALEGTGGPDLKPEIEARVGRLFRWHIDPAPLGMWIDRVDEKGSAVATEVPASIFYHLVTALMQYLDKTEEAVYRSPSFPQSINAAEPLAALNRETV
ncbi:AGE family epimerase/isomerase [Sinorhizobium meliloti]|jgi:mannose-1-phosphate guanylyltransferase/mannose-6-phosphate isomerase|uniref:AGE family epimerase/isomerase n=1 Tax=Rhizobium meliloti TaxID=382 RepID=UPI00040402E7|nr:AGE family epimerase/isomerase [Sinorhizobium meliloti]MDE3832843.1 AGE family epimerase/isomerase [Sinorhizobium meliloti]MDE4581486.1 AGE family epimerase/isomerase [Sinorhizobium meliloti]MDW9532036.1 mannose-1-phosphate guanylyltransferase [Sinorhizobium meliloti]MDW9682190.1 mannose-1-phosphate guanylyltransferase [Sinorhizobium meliloti]MDW9694795.1 mannose-1-phosphate guanylyltransferase [Sinorhizobium meliloti]